MPAPQAVDTSLEPSHGDPLPDAVVIVTNVSRDILGGVRAYLMPLESGLYAHGIFVKTLFFPAPLNLLESRGLPRSVRAPIHLLFVTLCLIRLLKLRARYPTVLVHSHGASYALLTSFLARALGFPAVHTFHSATRRRSVPLRLLSRGVSALVFVSRDLHRVYGEMSQVRNSKIYYIPGSVDPSSFRPLSGGDRDSMRSAVLRQFGLSDRGALVTFVGRIIPEKGVLELVEAVGAMRTAGTPATVLIFGPSLESAVGREYEARVRQRIKDLGAERSVALCGPIVHPEIERVLSVTDVFVCPSYAEGWPITIVEALSSGAAVVASRIGGIPEQVSPGETGILVEPGDVQQLAAQIHALVIDKEGRARIATNARQSAVSRFTDDAFVMQHLRLYRETLAGDRGSTSA